MKPVVRTRVCLAFNLVTLSAIILIVAIEGNGAYLEFGPSEKLDILGVKIDTWEKWGIVNALIVMISVADTFINEWGMPFITFRIYNPDCLKITDVGPIELQILANLMYFCWALKNMVYTLCYVTKIDFALFRILSGEFASIFTIRGLIKDKKFELGDTESVHSNHSNDSKKSNLYKIEKLSKEKNNYKNIYPTNYNSDDELTPLLEVKVDNNASIN